MWAGTALPRRGGGGQSPGGGDTGDDTQGTSSRATPRMRPGGRRRGAPTVIPRLLEAFPEGATVVDRLSAVGWHVAVAESCTGGLLGAAITAVPGASGCFRGGIVAYDDGVKIDLLGVPKDVLREHGAVSAEVAIAMARGVRQRLATEVGLAVTGIAGPGGGTAAKPIGLIWIAALGPDGPPLLSRLDEDQGREGNRAAAVEAALRLCLEIVGSQRGAMNED